MSSVFPKKCPKCFEPLRRSEDDTQDFCLCGWQGKVCPLCSLAEGVSKHHIVPASRGGREIVWLCEPCHHHLHVSFSNQELAEFYNTIESLLANEKVRKFIEWRHKHPQSLPSRKGKRKRR